MTSSNYCKVVVLFVPLNTESILQIGAVQGLMEHDAYTKSRRELVVLHCQQTNKYIYRFKPDISHLILHVSCEINVHLMQCPTDTKKLPQNKMASQILCQDEIKSFSRFTFLLK